jgi:hypothetical protein
LTAIGCFVEDDETGEAGLLVQVLAEIAWRVNVLNWPTRRPPRRAFRWTRRWRGEYAVLPPRTLIGGVWPSTVAVRVGP